MKPHAFRQFISNYTHCSNNDWAQIIPHFSRKEYTKGTTLLREGQICRKLYFLEEGFLRYFILKDGMEVCKFFTDPPYCFTSQRSFSQDIPAQENIETLEDSIVWEMDKADAYQLLRLPCWNTFTIKLIQEVQYYTELILEEIQNYTAEQRYIKMVESGDILLERVPLKHLASYLGIAPQSLSRIRKKYYQASRKLT